MTWWSLFMSIQKYIKKNGGGRSTTRNVWNFCLWNGRCSLILVWKVCYWVTLNSHGKLCHKTWTPMHKNLCGLDAVLKICFTHILDFAFNSTALGITGSLIVIWLCYIFIYSQICEWEECLWVGLSETVPNCLYVSGGQWQYPMGQAVLQLCCCSWHHSYMTEPCLPGKGFHSQQPVYFTDRLILRLVDDGGSRDQVYLNTTCLTSAKLNWPL